MSAPYYLRIFTQRRKVEIMKNEVETMKKVQSSDSTSAETLKQHEKRLQTELKNLDALVALQKLESEDQLFQTMLNSYR